MLCVPVQCVCPCSVFPSVNLVYIYGMYSLSLALRQVLGGRQVWTWLEWCTHEKAVTGGLGDQELSPPETVESLFTCSVWREDISILPPNTEGG